MDEQQRSPFFRELHAFRGIAILSIVIAHAAGTYSVFSGGKAAASAQDLVSLVHFAAWHDSTLWFALISGLLFPTVFARRGFAAFYRNRVLRVVLPYVLMTALFTPVAYRPAAPDEFLRWRGAGLGGYLDQFTYNLLHGTALHPYWYIPVLICLYLLTPLVWTLARRAPAALLLLAVVPLVSSRTGIHFSLQSVFYFLGAYAVGVYLGVDYPRRLQTLANRRIALAVVALACTLAIIALRLAQGPAPATGFSILESVFYVQKLALGALMLCWLRESPVGGNKMLAVCARFAFAIYFLHYLPLRILADLMVQHGPAGGGPLWDLGIILTLAAAATALSIGAARLLRRILGPRSRFVVGA
jgi:peptidoglycan/LPS O-acetylase OafA/YrhL